jgi:CRISPR system Cascade subunit CasE
VEQFGWPASGQGWDTIECDKFIADIKDGDIRRFRITVNPVRSVPVEERRGKVCHHITASQQLSWFVSRSGKCGFSVDEKDDGRCFASIVSRDIVKFKRGESNVTLSKVTVEGILKVLDAELVRQSISSGIGRGKAYGCGMLSLSGVQRWLPL